MRSAPWLIMWPKPIPAVMSRSSIESKRATSVHFV
jgi:hypothetical protein